MRQFGNLTIFLFCLNVLFSSCNNLKEEPFVIGKHYKKSLIDKSYPPSPPPPPINYYGRNNILLTDSLIFMHIRPYRLFPGCGTGLTRDHIERIDLKPDEIIRISNINEILSHLQLDKEYDLVDIACVTDTIRNPYFEQIITSLSTASLDLIRVRTFSQEEYWVTKSIQEDSQYHSDSVLWNIVPKLDVLFDLDKDGKFEIHENLN